MNTEKKIQIKNVIIGVALLVATAFVAIKFAYPAGIEFGEIVVKSLF